MFVSARRQRRRDLENGALIAKYSINEPGASHAIRRRYAIVTEPMTDLLQRGSARSHGQAPRCRLINQPAVQARTSALRRCRVAASQRGEVVHQRRPNYPRRKELDISAAIIQLPSPLTAHSRKPPPSANRCMRVRTICRPAIGEDTWLTLMKSSLATPIQMTAQYAGATPACSAPQCLADRLSRRPYRRLRGRRHLQEWRRRSGHSWQFRARLRLQCSWLGNSGATACDSQAAWSGTTRDGRADLRSAALRQRAAAMPGATFIIGGQHYRTAATAAAHRGLSTCSPGPGRPGQYLLQFWPPPPTRTHGSGV